MAIRDWHARQVLGVWAGGLALEWCLYWLLCAADYPPIPLVPVRVAVAMTILIALLCIPLGLCLMTWHWWRYR